MNSRTMILAVALSLLAGAPAFGQGHGRSNGYDRGHNEQFGRGGPPAERGRDFRPERPDNRGRPGDRGFPGHGAGPYHDLYRGGHLPHEYRTRQYVVNDWRHHHLHPPPRGYYWVQTGADYVLVAIATGLIVEIVINP